MKGLEEKNNSSSSASSNIPMKGLERRGSGPEERGRLPLLEQLLRDLQIRAVALLRAKDIAAFASTSRKFGSPEFLSQVERVIASSLYPDFAGRRGTEQKLPPLVRLRLFELKRVAGVIAAPECAHGARGGYWISKVWRESAPSEA